MRDIYLMRNVIKPKSFRQMFSTYTLSIWLHSLEYSFGFDLRVCNAWSAWYCKLSVCLSVCLTNHNCFTIWKICCTIHNISLWPVKSCTLQKIETSTWYWFIKYNQWRKWKLSVGKYISILKSFNVNYHSHRASAAGPHTGCNVACCDIVHRGGSSLVHWIRQWVWYSELLMKDYL